MFQVVMSPHEPPQAFVDSFIKLLPESEPHEFQKVLDMKVRKCSPYQIQALISTLMVLLCC